MIKSTLLIALVYCACSVHALDKNKGKASKMTKKHINKEMVSAIKTKTSIWKPYEPEENPFRDFTDEQLLMLVGTWVQPPTEEELNNPGRNLMESDDYVIDYDPTETDIHGRDL